jgi:formylglycine-generating enzyme required for sulfatase activity
MKQGEETVPVGSLPANGWGLYEMHGNVYEWCSDWYEESLGTVPVTDPTGPKTGELRVLRGGSWRIDARLVRSAQRFANHPGLRIDYVGFRLARGP